MTGEWRIGKDLKGSNFVLIEVLSLYIPEATEENHENCITGVLAVSWAEYIPKTGFRV